MLHRSYILKIILLSIQLLLLLLIPVGLHQFFINQNQGDLEYGFKNASIIKFFDVSKSTPSGFIQDDYQKLMLMDFQDSCKYEFHADIKNVPNSKFKIGDRILFFYIRMTDVNCEGEQQFVFTTAIHYLNPRLWMILIIVFSWMLTIIQTISKIKRTIQK